ncbi:hypothetical protein N7540_011375 [Penicillium herquei]|nr:hypothetical protein N7540_011375 [Penicillium herquei]
MHRRRPHNKSRNGCQNCKRRKVKCDEVHPVCSNCSERQVECIFTRPGPYLWTERSSSKPRRSKQSLADADSPSTSTIFSGGTPPESTHSDQASNPASTETPVSLNMEQLELTVQWIKHTHKDFVRGEETRKIMEISVLEAGLTAPYLMHGVMALSALHLSHQSQPDQRRRGSSWFTIAMHHQNAALSMFRDQLNQINEANVHASLIFAGLAASFGFASALQTEAKEEMPSLNTLLKIFDLARGLKAVLDSTSHLQQENDLNPLLAFEVPADAAVPNCTQSAFDRLVELSEQMDHHTEYYKRAIKSMRFLSSISFAGPTSMTLSVGWASMIPREYLEDIKCRKPFALVVLAHYCVFLHMGQRNWCLGRWGYEVLLEISQILDLEWKPYIAWPLEQVLGQL